MALYQELPPFLLYYFFTHLYWLERQDTLRNQIQFQVSSLKLLDFVSSSKRIHLIAPFYSTIFVKNTGVLFLPTMLNVTHNNKTKDLVCIEL